MVDAFFFTLWKTTRLTFKLFAIFFPLAVDDFYFISLEYNARHFLTSWAIFRPTDDPSSLASWWITNV